MQLRAVTAKLSNAKDTYYVRAQLPAGGGTVTVEILVNGKVLSTGTASGGDHIAWAQICPGPTTGQWKSCN